MKSMKEIFENTLKELGNDFKFKSGTELIVDQGGKDITVTVTQVDKKAGKVKVKSSDGTDLGWYEVGNVKLNEGVSKYVKGLLSKGDKSAKPKLISSVKGDFAKDWDDEDWENVIDKAYLKGLQDGEDADSGRSPKPSKNPLDLAYVDGFKDGVAERELNK